MTTVWFVVPAHGRFDVTRVCLRQLARTCEAMREYGIEASAVVVADDKNLRTAKKIGFATVKRDNSALGRRFNDGFQFACDPKFNPRPVDYVVPCGSDDWVDPVIFRQLPGERIGIFRQLAVVNEDRTKLQHLRVRYQCGLGTKIIPRSLIALAGYRPADEDRKRAIDMSTWHGIVEANGRRLPLTVDLDVHPLQIVDWKNRDMQLNSYESLRMHRRHESTDPFGDLAAHYPLEALDDMRALTRWSVAA